MSEKKLYEFGHMHQPRLFGDEALADGLGRNLDGLEIIMLKARKSAQEISASKHLTPSGKVDQLKNLSEKVDRETKQWRADMKYSEMILQVEAEMKPIPKKENDFVGELRRYEIRKHLRSLDPILLEAFYREAAIAGNDEVLAAIETSPIAFSFAAEGQIKKIQAQRLAVQYPVQASRLNDLRIASDSADAALNGVRGALHTDGLRIVGQDAVILAATA